MADVVVSSVVQEGVSRMSSYILGKLDEKVSREEIMERLQMALYRLEFALEWTAEWPIAYVHVSLIRRRMMLKKFYKKGIDLLNKLKLQPVEGREEIGRWVTGSSFLQWISRATNLPFLSLIGLGKEHMSSSIVRKFERYADLADMFVTDVKSGYALWHDIFHYPLERQLLEGKTRTYEIVKGRQTCKRPRSPDSGGPPNRLQRSTGAQVAVSNPCPGDFMLAEQAPAASRSSSPLSSPGSTPVGPSSRHTLPSPPPLVSVPGAPDRRPRFELRIIPRTEAMNAAEEELSNALVAVIRGSRTVDSVAQVKLHLLEHYQVGDSDVEVRRYQLDDFLLVFSDRTVADRVLHAQPPQNALIRLLFRRWGREAGASAAPMVFKVMLAIDNIPAHAWSVETAQNIVGSSCLILQMAPTNTASKSDMSRFMVVAWCVHPDLIPTGIIPEPEEPFVDRAPPLFFRAEETIWRHFVSAP